MLKNDDDDTRHHTKINYPYLNWKSRRKKLIQTSSLGDRYIIYIAEGHRCQAVSYNRINFAFQDFSPHYFSELRVERKQMANFNLSLSWISRFHAAQITDFVRIIIIIIHLRFAMHWAEVPIFVLLFCPRSLRLRNHFWLLAFSISAWFVFAEI